MENLVLEPIAQSFPQEIVLDVKSTEEVIAQAKSKVVYLKEGMTGKQLTKLKINANNASKEECKSASWCIKQLTKHGQEFLNSFSNYSPSDITPANLLPLRTEKQVERGTFSVWLMTQLITKFYKG